VEPDPRINLRIAKSCENCYFFSELQWTLTIASPGYCRPEGLKKRSIATLKDKNLKITTKNCVCDRHKFSQNSHTKAMEAITDHEFFPNGSARKIEEDYDWGLG